jgi:hypothetical protein
MTSQNDVSPTVFLSYSWSSPEFVDRVTALAERLVSHSVEVIYDQWDLHEGHDLHAFMEQSVARPDVTHVLILCDPVYAAKADDRSGGVGKETLIISPAVYENVEQRRVIPIIMQRDSDDQVKVPLYLRGRRYVDMSRPDSEAEAYEQLLRILYDKPARVRPPRGDRPDFLNEDYVALGTTGSLALFRSAALAGRPNASGLFTDLLERFYRAIRDRELVDALGSLDDLEDWTSNSIDGFLGYRDEFVQAVQTLARHVHSSDGYSRLHSFFESAVNLVYGHQDRLFGEGVEAENISFLVWELYLYTVATLLREERFEGVGRLTAPMHVRSRSGDGVLRGIGVLDPSFLLLERRNQRLRLNKISFAATLLKQRANNPQVPYEAVMESDLLLWYRTVAAGEKDVRWYPRSLVYIGYTQRLPLFERARDSEYFKRLAPALGVSSRDDFEARFTAIDSQLFFTIQQSMYGRNSYAQHLGIAST